MLSCLTEFEFLFLDQYTVIFNDFVISLCYYYYLYNYYRELLVLYYSNISVVYIHVI